MILSNNGDWLFVSTMKNATNTLYAGLEPFGFRIRARESHPVPVRRMADLQWSVCRNPYDRAVSIWASTALRDENDKYNVRQIITERGGNWKCFKDFIALVLLRTPRPRVPFLFEPQHLWHARFDHDKMIRFERLREVDYIVGKKIELPRLNSSERTDWNDYMDEEVAHLIEQWAGNDFDNYGYQKWHSQPSTN